MAYAAKEEDIKKKNKRKKKQPKDGGLAMAKRENLKGPRLLIDGPERVRGGCECVLLIISQPCK